MKTLEELKELAVIGEILSRHDTNTCGGLAEQAYKLREAIAIEALSLLQPTVPVVPPVSGHCTPYVETSRLTTDTERMNLMEKHVGLASYREASNGLRWQILTPEEISRNLHYSLPYHATLRDAIDAMIGRQKKTPSS